MSYVSVLGVALTEAGFRLPSLRKYCVLCLIDDRCIAGNMCLSNMTAQTCLSYDRSDTCLSNMTAQTRVLNMNAQTLVVAEALNPNKPIRHISVKHGRSDMSVSNMAAQTRACET